MSYKLSFWKKLSSWILPYNIETITSKTSGQLEVNLQYGNIVIDSPNANYSFGNLHIVFREAISHLQLDFSKQYKVLILGFGAGSISHILRNEINLNCSIVGIEIDTEIIKLSKKYFPPSIFKRTTIISKDASTFMSSNSEKFDLIFIDLFIDTFTPEVFQQKDFFTQIKNSLSSNAQVLMNTMSDNLKIKKNWKEIFKTCDIITVQENEVLIFKE